MKHGITPLLAVATLALSAAVGAQTWPSKPVRLRAAFPIELQLD